MDDAGFDMGTFYCLYGQMVSRSTGGTMPPTLGANPDRRAIRNPIGVPMHRLRHTRTQFRFS